MKTKLIILSSSDTFFTSPIHNILSKDSRIDIQKIYIIKEKNHLLKKIKILFLLNLYDYFKIIKKFITSVYRNKKFIKYKYFSNINTKTFINSINENEADLIVCINCPQISNKNTIKEIKFPIFNFHPGDIPSFRGVFIPFFLLKYKIKQACLTFHKIDHNIDKGEIINKKYFDLKSKDNIFSIYEKIFLSKESINFIIFSIINYKKIFYKETNSIDKYYSQPSLIEILKFRFR